jgi:hypothetical protein
MVELVFNLLSQELLLIMLAVAAALAIYQARLVLAGQVVAAMEALLQLMRLDRLAQQIQVAAVAAQMELLEPAEAEGLVLWLFAIQIRLKTPHPQQGHPHLPIPAGTKFIVLPPVAQLLSEVTHEPKIPRWFYNQISNCSHIVGSKRHLDA